MNVSMFILIIRRNIAKVDGILQQFTVFCAGFFLCVFSVPYGQRNFLNFVLQTKTSDNFVPREYWLSYSLGDTE